MGLQFEWDEAKAQANIRKHGISFEEAVTVFGDASSITIYDVEHSGEEDRFIDVGRSIGGRILVVVYAERCERIRVISCRSATPAERRQYEQQES